MSSYTILYIGAAWCKTCKEIKPATESLAAQFAVPLTIKDYDEDLDETEQASIKKVPTIRILAATGNQIAEWNVNQVASLREWLTSNIHVGSTDDF
jgi:thioredoxin-like negative regulator of GroEL